MIYTVTFNPAVDYVVRTDRLINGATNRVSDAGVFFGGKGINVSAVLRRLGLESVALGFVAGFTGDAIERGVTEQGVKTDFVHLSDGLSRINVKIKSDEETELNASGPSVSHGALSELMTKLDRLHGGDTLVLAGSVPKNLPSDIYEKILARLDGKGIRFVVDAAGDLLMNVLRYKPFLIKPNNFELGEIFGKSLNSAEEITACARELQQRGAKNVLVSRAGDGAILLDENGEVHSIGVPEGKVLNSVGAGDSMIAGFLAGLDGGFRRALILGTAAGSATAFSDGLAESEDIKRLEEVMGERF